MTKTRKVELLYKIAKGQHTDATSAELRELKKYKVDFNEASLYVKKANISAYVSAVDNDGFRRSFYDFCRDNRIADRRRKGSSEKEIANEDRELGIAVILMGWLTWGMAIYWMFHGSLSVGTSAVMGMIVSFCLCKFARKASGFTVFVLPLALAVIFGR